jgi:hypothetical protein
MVAPVKQALQGTQLLVDLPLTFCLKFLHLLPQAPDGYDKLPKVVVGVSRVVGQLCQLAAM